MATSDASRPWSVGSAWSRWDPHIHTPGTLRNDLFGGDWNAYVRKIEQAEPAPVVLGVTDYFCLRGYNELRKRQREGALPNILLFPNIELRLTIETERRQGINLRANASNFLQLRGASQRGREKIRV